MERAKDYLSGALGAMLDLGAGQGPMDHLHSLSGAFLGGPEERGCGG